MINTLYSIIIKSNEKKQREKEPNEETHFRYPTKYFTRMTNNLNIDDGTACVGTETHGHTHTKKEYCYR